MATQGNIGADNLSNTYKTWSNNSMTAVETSFKKGIDHRQGIFKMDSTDQVEDKIIEIEKIIRYFMTIMGSGKAWVDDAMHLFDHIWNDYKRIRFSYHNGQFHYTRENIRQFKVDYQGVLMHFEILLHLVNL